jgi:hypothetical protein
VLDAVEISVGDNRGGDRYRRLTADFDVCKGVSPIESTIIRHGSDRIVIKTLDDNVGGLWRYPSNYNEHVLSF